MKWLKGDWLTRLLVLLYLSIAGATFRHSMFGFATIEQSGMFWAGLSALAIDAGMMLSAIGLRQQFRWTLALGLALSGAASAFTQLLFAIGNAEAIVIAPGASWLGTWATNIANVRVVLLPALLPLLATVYAFASKSKHSLADELARQTQLVFNLEAVNDSLESELERLRDAPQQLESPAPEQEFMCTLCGWDKGKTQRALNSHWGFHAREARAAISIPAALAMFRSEYPEAWENEHKPVTIAQVAKWRA